MNSSFKIIQAKDWSIIKDLEYDEAIFCDECSYNLGITLDNNKRYRSVGLVGLCVLKNKNGFDYINSEGKKVILIVQPRFDVDPWHMLLEVMHDDEYELYEKDLDRDFFHIDAYAVPINVQTSDIGGELLLAISFIRSCFKVCSTILKKSVGIKCQNLNGKIKGKIDFHKHLIRNVVKGRQDRIYCKTPYFTDDILLNQILKSALVTSFQYISLNMTCSSNELQQIREMYKYCSNTLKNVGPLKANRNQIMGIKLKGFDSVYKAAYSLAVKVLYNGKISVSAYGRNANLIVPYSIRMEVIFELYVRTLIKRYLKDKGLDQFLRVANYTTNKESTFVTTDNDDCYLMKHFIPDIVFEWFDVDSSEWKYVGVFDVKYQYSNNRMDKDTRRNNTHQLLFYMLMLNVKKCGFVFPMEEYSKTVYSSLNIQNSNAYKIPREYAQFYIGQGKNDTVKELINFVVENINENNR